MWGSATLLDEIRAEFTTPAPAVAAELTNDSRIVTVNRPR
jgi:hypothetical protein